jgi:hypothetical protein
VSGENPKNPQLNMDLWEIPACTPWRRSPLLATPLTTTTMQQGAWGLFTNSCSDNEFTQWMKMKSIILFDNSLSYVRY